MSQEKTQNKVELFKPLCNPSCCIAMSKTPETVSQLNPAPFNPRVITEDTLSALKFSLDEYGDLGGIIFNAKLGYLAGGHQRSTALPETATIEITNRYKKPTRTGTIAEGYVLFNGERYSYREVNWDEQKHRAALVAANSPSLQGEFTVGLKELLDQMKIEMPDEFKLLGFDVLKIPNPTFNYDGEEKETPISSSNPIVKLGDIFRLGEHRVMCGDSTNAVDPSKLFGERLADLWLTDPPYGVSYADKNKFLNSISRGNRNQTEIENDHHSIEDMKPIWGGASETAAKFTTNEASYYWCACQGGDQMMMMMMIAGFWKVRHELIWVKNNHVLGRTDYNYKHEPILYGWKQNGVHHFYGGFKTSVLEYDKPRSSKEHPTMKPVALFQELIANSSKVGDMVYDGFLGSGTTLIASHKLGRTCYGLEISPAYVEVIIRRFAENCADDNGDVDFEHINGTLTLEAIVANVNKDPNE